MYDLHTHSTCSDGGLPPSELVALAKVNGVTVLALTDHDTVAGVEQAQAQAAATSDIEIVTGIEFSALHAFREGSAGMGVHIVGLQIDLQSEVLIQAVAQQTQARNKRAEQIAHRLEKVGVKGSLEGAKHYAGDGVIGRPHFAQYLIDAGYVNTFAQAFQRYLGSGKPGDVKQLWPSMARVVQWILESGGIPVLAHPDKYELTRTKLYELLDAFVTAGGQALEVVSGQQEAGVTNKLAQAAEEFSLLASCGSDFHHPNQPWQALGKIPQLPVSCQPVWEAF